MLTLVMWLAVPAAAFAESPSHTLNGLSLPTRAEATWIAKDMTQNGMPMAIQTFQSPRSVENVLDFYRQAWSLPGDVRGFVENSVGGWKMISRLANDHNVVLQIRDDAGGGSSGFLSAMALEVAGTTPQDDIPIPANAELVSNTRVVDGNRVSRTTVLLSHADRGSIVGFYRDRLQRKGWNLAADRNQNGHHFLYFNQKRAKCELVVSDAADGTSVISLNRVQFDG